MGSCLLASLVLLPSAKKAMLNCCRGHLVGKYSAEDLGQGHTNSLLAHVGECRGGGWHALANATSLIETGFHVHGCQAPNTEWTVSPWGTRTDTVLHVCAEPSAVAAQPPGTTTIQIINELLIMAALLVLNNHCTSHPYLIHL